MEPKNVVRSKRLIKNAVMELILKKNAADIKVTEITAFAEINRGTFYAHYNTIFDVISEIEDDIIDNFLLPFRSSGCQPVNSHKNANINQFQFIDFTFIDEMLNYGYNHQDLILKHYRRNVFPNLMLKMKERIYEHIIQHSIISSSEQIQLDYKIIVSYMVSGYVGLITDWVNGNLGKNITPEIIIPYIKKMILKLSEMKS